MKICFPYMRSKYVVITLCWSLTVNIFQNTLHKRGLFCETYCVVAGGYGVMKQALPVFGSPFSGAWSNRGAIVVFTCCKSGSDC